MKLYIINGRQCWYLPEEAPEGAQEVKAKAKRPANKSRSAEEKQGK